MAVEVRRRESDYEVLVDGVHAGLSAFEERDGTIVFVHTEIDDAFEGQGIGSQLAKAALQDAKARGLRIVATCPFIRAYLKKHPEVIA